MRLVFGLVMCLGLLACGPGVSTPSQPRPSEMRVSAATQAAFDRWVAAFKPRAGAKGVSERTLTRAFANVRYRPDVVQKDRNQAEFALPIWDYLALTGSPERIAKGKAALRKHARVLDQIEARYGVEKEVVVAVWGVETRYGETRGDIPVIDALSTLAFDGRRGAFFEAQLVEALKILQRGDITPAAMQGSWAGAMGHTQFIPTSFQAYAVDFDGDGRRDIWDDNPVDALASTAAYLARFGWNKDVPWGVEVTLAPGTDTSLAGKSRRLTPAQWAARGVRGLNGQAVPDYGPASLLLPAGANGPGFLIFDNFITLSRYNAADAYVMGVGHLSDRLKGKRAIQGRWPIGDRALNRAERTEMQRRLTRAGFSTQGSDGLIGPNTTNAIRAYQSARGLKVDGYASLALLQRLRRGL
ncbi:lytic murein transglycosylase [Shimia ponticola]|uniref:lytic murein transglycosylase n=1 Tax=Shimia ponticola TaxID=2582893 RepID=UPI0011BFDF07|nr:lytic murein transglycosylase [Shimia ponticola]